MFPTPFLLSIKNCLLITLFMMMAEEGGLGEGPEGKYTLHHIN